MEENNRIYYFKKKTEQSLEWIIYNLDNINMHEDESVDIFSYSDCILFKCN